LPATHRSCACAINQAGAVMKYIGLLAIIPFIGMFVGPVFHNSSTPFILGMPFILGWIVVWMIITSIVMAIIFWLDPIRLSANPDGDAG
jgi:hypothetical protein